MAGDRGGGWEETQCSPRGGRQSCAPHLPLPVPEHRSRNKGPLSAPQYPALLPRLGLAPGCSEGPFCAGMNGSLFPAGGCPPPAAGLGPCWATKPPREHPWGSGPQEILGVGSSLPPSPTGW